MNAQPLLFLGDKRRRTLLSRIADSARRWRQSWAKTGESFEVHCEAPSDEGFAEPVASISTTCWSLDIGGDRQAMLLLPHAVAHWAVHDGGAQGLDASSMAPEGSIAEMLEQEIATTLLAELCAIDRREAVVVEHVSADTIADWSRDSRAWALQLRVPGLSRALVVLVSARRFEMLAPARAVLPATALVSRREAVGNNSLSLRAVVGELEMSVSELSDVAIDDVLVLEQHLTDPIELLSLHANQAVAVGNLGRAGARRAIKITGIASRN